MSDIKKRLQDIFRYVFEKKNLKIFDEMTANDIEEWDSLMHINLIIAIEKEFSIKFKLGELVELGNVGDTIQLIEKKLMKQN
ncbi:MAG: acyl carrier protein [Candidatus Omnitrophota bacterium]